MDSEDEDDDWNEESAEESEDERKVAANPTKKKRRKPWLPPKVKPEKYAEPEVSLESYLRWRRGSKKRKRRVTKAPSRPDTPFHRFLVDSFGKKYANDARKIKEGASKLSRRDVSKREEEESKRWRELSKEQRAAYTKAHDEDWTTYMEDVEDYIRIDPKINMKKPRNALTVFRESRPDLKIEGDGTKAFEAIPEDERESYKITARQERLQYTKLAPYRNFLYDIEQYKERFRPKNTTTAFGLYVNQRKNELRKQDLPEDLDMQNETEAWDLLSPADKLPFEKLAELGTVAYQADMKRFEEMSKVEFPGPVPKPVSFSHYVDLHSDELKAEFKAADRTIYRTFVSVCAAKWRGLSASERQKYKRLSDAAREEAHRVHAEKVKRYENVPWVKYVLDSTIALNISLERHNRAYLQDEYRRKQNQKPKDAEPQKPNEEQGKGATKPKPHRPWHVIPDHIKETRMFDLEMAARTEDHEMDKRANMREHALFVDWRTLSKTEFGSVALKQTDRLEHMVGWATHLTGPTDPGCHNPLLGLPNIPPRVTQIHETILVRANDITHKGWLSGIRHRLDHSSLVAMGMLLEDAMTTALLPFAIEHVQKCREYEACHDGHSPDWIIAPEKAITKLGKSCTLITTMAPSCSSVDNGKGKLDDQLYAWKSWCKTQGINPKRAGDDNLFFFKVPTGSAPPDNDTDDSDDTSSLETLEQCLSESSEEDADSDSSSTASLGQLTPDDDTPQLSAVSSVASSVTSPVVPVEV